MAWQIPLIKNYLYEIGVAYNGVQHWRRLQGKILTVLSAHFSNVTLLSA